MIPHEHHAIRCMHCRERGDQHRDRDGRCPASGPWPVASNDAHSSDAAVAAAALAAWDREIERYWSARSTTFEPRR